MPTEETQLAVIATKMDRVGIDIKEIKDGLAQNYVTRSEIKPLQEKLEAFQRGFFWFVSIVALALLTAFLRLVGVIK